VTVQNAVADSQGLLDTSIFVAREVGRPLGPLPPRGAISVVTVAELHLGVLIADDPPVHARRMRTFQSVQELFDPIPIDAAIARVFAALVAEARHQGHRPKAHDAWIAATAVAHGLPLYTRDDDFAAIPRVVVVRV
jgi:predicted nucleic acid-binding protein